MMMESRLSRLGSGERGIMDSVGLDQRRGVGNGRGARRERGFRRRLEDVGLTSRTEVRTGGDSLFGSKPILEGVAVAPLHIIQYCFMLDFLGDAAYLSRIAFLMDNIMCKFVLHGRSNIPTLWG